jgi:hypothetical protein
MAQNASFAEQIGTNLSKVEAQPEFVGDHLWLTFYLCGPPERLALLAVALRAHGWINLDGGQGGFVYAKVQAEKSFAAIVETAESTDMLCAEHGIDIDLITADTSPDVEHCQFEILYRDRREPGLYPAREISVP